jgi:hypothetical protein
MKAVLAFVACLAIASCASVPKYPPSVYGAEARGHTLDPTDALVVNVSNLWLSAGSSAKAEADPKNHPAIEPAGDLEALRKSFMSGFREVKQESRILPADEHVRAACFTSAGLTEREPWNEPVRPSLDSPACQAALQPSRVRYLVSVHAWLAIESKSTFEAYPLGMGTSKDIRYHFEVVAAIFDVGTGKQICIDRDSQYAQGDFIAGIILVPAPLPVPVPLVWGTRVDAQAYWKQTAWQAGARTANCFVPPTEAVNTASTESHNCGGLPLNTADTTPGNDTKPDALRWCLVDRQACPVRCDLVDYESCASAKPDHQHRCVLR